MGGARKKGDIVVQGGKVKESHERKKAFNNILTERQAEDVDVAL